VLQRLTVPTLVLVGSEDRLTPPSHARRIASALPDPVGIVELPLTGHMAPLERPAEVNRWLRNLAQRAGGATARVPGASRAA